MLNAVGYVDTYLLSIVFFFFFFNHEVTLKNSPVWNIKISIPWVLYNTIVLKDTIAPLYVLLINK